VDRNYAPSRIYADSALPRITEEVRNASLPAKPLEYVIGEVQQSARGLSIAASNARCFSGALFGAAAKLDESHRAETRAWARLARRPWLSDERADGPP
jgi:hypothetical protein